MKTRTKKSMASETTMILPLYREPLLSMAAVPMLWKGGEMEGENDDDDDDLEAMACGRKKVTEMGG